MNKAVLIFAFLLGLPEAANSATLRVPSQYGILQSAINAAESGDTVLVAAGTYSDIIGPNQHVIDFESKSYLTIISEEGKDYTIIDGGYTEAHGAVRCYYCDNCKLIGFTLTNSLTSNLSSYDAAELVISDCISTASGRSGIDIGYQTTALIENCIVHNNQGYGIETHDTSPTNIVSCYIYENQLEGILFRGSGELIANSVYNNLATGIKVNCNVLMNWNTIYSNGQYGVDYSGSGILSHNTIVSNKSAGVYLNQSTPSKYHELTLNLIINNEYAGILVNSGFNIIVSCNDVWGNSNFANGNYVGFITDQTGYNGNISVDPSFCNPSSDDYSLASNSLALMQTCGAMGAILEPGCSPIMATIEKSWGAIKSLYNE